MSTVAERVVEIQVEGRALGLAREDLAGAVVRALEIKRQIKALETELDKALADVRFGVDQAGLKDRPLHLAAEGLGKASISETPPSAKASRMFSSPVWRAGRMCSGRAARARS